MRTGRDGSTARTLSKVGPLIRFLEEQGRDVVRCNIGEPDFPVPAFIKEEVKRQIDLDNTHYCDPQGDPLPPGGHRKAAFGNTGIRAGGGTRRCLSGRKAPIGLCQQTYCGPGDEVVYPSPRFPDLRILHPLRGRNAGAHPSEGGERVFPPGEELESVLTEKTKLIFLNFPPIRREGSPPGEQLQEIARVIHARCREDVRIFSDEIYEHILFDSHRHHSILSCPGMEKNTILVSGASKSFAWTGGRIGWALFPTRE